MPEVQTTRHNGYVVGQNNSGSKGQPYWTVRVKDPESPHNGKKFPVVSTREGITLAQGLNVNFVIGSVDGENGQKVMKAVDVCPSQS